jgi:RNA binding exosome subunit
MKIHNIKVSAFFKQDEVENGRLILKQLLGETPVEEEKLEPESEGGVFNEPLTALKATLPSQKEIKLLLDKITSGLDSEDKSELKQTLDSRIDDDCNLYIRLGKKSLLEGKLRLYSRDPVHIRIKLAVFPKKKESAISTALELLKER